MKNYKEMTEEEFIERLDAHFRFDDKRKYEEMVHIGCSISDNTALMVGYELAVEPNSIPLRLHLLALLKENRPTPLIHAAAPVIESLIMGKAIEKDVLEELLACCRKNPGSYNGLCIVAAVDKKKEHDCEEIRKQWELK